MSSTLQSVQSTCKPSKPKFGKIVLIKGSSQYDVLRVFIDHLADAFRALGEDAVVVDLNENYVEDLKKVNGHIQFFVSFNGNGLSLMSGNRPLYDVINVPVVSWFVDHPFYHWDRICYQLNQRLMFLSNDNSYDFYARYLRKPATVSQCLQLAGCQVVPEIIPIAERPYDLVFFGSCVGSLKELEQKLDFGHPTLNTVVWDIVEQAKMETERELHEIFLERMTEAGLPPLELDPGKMGALLSEIDRYIRTYRRNHVLQSLGDYPITIFGNGWEHFEHRKPSMTFQPAIPFLETLAMMGQSKVVLNIMPNNRTGIHERLAYAMHQGAVCLSEDIPGLRADFQHENHLFNYAFQANLPELLPQQLDQLFSQPDRLQAVADAGRQKAGEKYHWEHRAQAILDALEVHKVAMCLK